MKILLAWSRLAAGEWSFGIPAGDPAGVRPAGDPA
jgi:hypothetical protein